MIVTNLVTCSMQEYTNSVISKQPVAMAGVAIAAISLLATHWLPHGAAAPPHATLVPETPQEEAAPVVLP